MAAALLGAVLGPALQVQQPHLWGWAAYAAMIAIGAVLLGSLTRLRERAGVRVCIGRTLIPRLLPHAGEGANTVLLVAHINT